MQLADITNDNLYLGGLAKKLYLSAGAVGAVILAAGALIAFSQPDGGAQFYPAYLVSFVFYLSLALGALFFVMLQQLSGAGWSVTVRRLAEGIANTMPLLAILSIPVLLGMHDLYPWTHAEAVAHDPVLAQKAPYLNVSFFVIRCVIYFTVWSGLAWYFRHSSVAQDKTGDPETTLRMSRRAAVGMILFALTITFAAFDFLMSRDPHWYSTIYGVYYFSGGVVGFFAVLTWGVLLLQKAGRIKHAVTMEHYHDLGKLMFAFIVFWAYIAFSQYMLIWYANIPEETVWFLRRQTGAWANFSLFLVFGHFLVPFLALISRWPKRRKKALAVGAFWVMLVHAADMYWLVMPEATLGTAGLGFNLYHLTGIVGMGALFFAAATFSLRKCALIPIKDPRLEEALSFENV